RCPRDGRRDRSTRRRRSADRIGAGLGRPLAVCVARARHASPLHGYFFFFAGATVRVRETSVVSPSASFTEDDSGNEPAFLAVPLRTPVVLLRRMPVGNLPDVTFHTNGWTPPLVRSTAREGLAAFLGGGVSRLVGASR